MSNCILKYLIKVCTRFPYFWCAVSKIPEQPLVQSNTVGYKIIKINVKKQYGQIMYPVTLKQPNVIRR